MNLKVNVVLDPNQGYKEFNSWSNRVQAQVNKNPIKVKIDVDGQQYEKSIETWIGKNHDLVEVTKLVNTATKQEIEYISKVEDGMSRLASATSNQVNQTRNLSNAQSKLNTHTQKSVSIFQDFTNTFLKMAKFNTINMIYDGIINNMSKCIDITNDFNSAMIEFKKVTDTSQISLNSYVETLDKLGSTVGFSRTEMLEAATEYSKGGFDADTAAQLARVSSLYRNIADEELSAGDAASYVISQLKAFNMETDNVAETTKNAMSIIDKTNEVKLLLTSINCVNFWKAKTLIRHANQKPSLI